MRKYLLPIAFSSLVLSLGLFFQSFSQIETKAKTKLKLAYEQFLIDFERKTSFLDHLGQKTTLRQLTRQGTKLPILVDYKDAHWHILKPSEHYRLDVGHFSNELQKIVLPIWNRVDDPLENKSLYFRLIPSADGRHKVFEVKNFEKAFFEEHGKLKFSFTSCHPKKSPFLFFDSFETVNTTVATFSWRGCTVKMEKVLEGICDPLSISFRFSFPWVTVALATLTIFFFSLFLFEIFFYLRSKKHRKAAITMLTTLALLVFSILIQENRKTAYQTFQHKTAQAKNYTETGVRNYLLHIEQMAKSLLSIFEENPKNLEPPFLKRWGYLQKIRLIDHEKNCIIEIAQEGLEKSKSLSTLFMKESGWIGPDMKNSQAGFIYFTTQNEKTIYLQLSLKPLLDPLFVLKEETGLSFELGRSDSRDFSSDRHLFMSSSPPFFAYTSVSSTYNPVPWVLFSILNFTVFLLSLFWILTDGSFFKPIDKKKFRLGVNFTKRGMIR
ncbi:MAG: hypothetical protein FJZ60_01870 [Chlamydiae bacterium]|nr:hypothetical protein [Chlamydiota bacterium]